MANEFFLHDGAGNGPSLKYAGADVGRRPVRGLDAARGREGWQRLPGGLEERQRRPVHRLEPRQQRQLDQQSTGVVSGSEYAFQSLEATFQQDLNGDGTTGLKTTPIETSGATHLDQVANEFFLHDSAGNGPSLKYAGADVGRRPVRRPGRRSGRRRSASGYQVVWKNGSADQYIVWNLDSNGNWTSSQRAWCQVPSMRSSRWRRRSSRISTPTARRA